MPDVQNSGIGSKVWKVKAKQRSLIRPVTEFLARARRPDHSADKTASIQA